MVVGFQPMTQVSRCHRSTHVSCRRRKTCPKFYICMILVPGYVLGLFWCKLTDIRIFKNVLCMYGYAVHMDVLVTNNSEASGGSGWSKNSQEIYTKKSIAIMFLQPKEVICFFRFLWFLDSGLLQPGADWSRCSLADFGILMPCQMC